MATQQDAFIANLGRIYTVYVGGFVGFVILMAILEFLGVPFRFILWGYMALTIGIYAFIGILSRTALVSEYYVAGRKVPAVYNGMATGADWMSGASFVGMAGSLYVLGYDGLAFVLGWTGGYVLVAVLIAPYLRKFGAYTIPDFLGTRFGGNFPRLLGIVVLFCCSFTYVTAQVYASGIIASQFLGIDFNYAVFAGLAGILVCSMLGGMRAVTWTQVAQYIVLIIAYLLPAIWMSTVVTGVPIPQLMYGSVLGDITAMEQQFIAAGESVKPHVEAFTNYSPRDFFFLIFCLMVGTASLPHILMRFFTTPTVREARKSVGWSLFFIFLLYFTAPSYAAFAKYNVMSLFIETGGIALPFEQIPQWMFRWGSIEGHTLVQICGEKAVSLEVVRAACEAKGFAEGFPFNELNLNNDMIVLSTPEIAGMPWFVVGLVGAGGFAAALSTADGLLLAIANALSHDVYYRMIDPKADSKRRLFVAKVLLLVVAVGAALLARTKPSDILSMVAWAFSLAGAGLFAPLVLGVWDARANRAGAIWGMICGFGLTLGYLVGNVYGFDLTKGTGDEFSWFGVASISAGIFGIPVAFVVMFVVSRMTQAPSAEMQDMILRLRVPRGAQVMVQTH
ncbi:MAG TPA: sodium:solute symporter family protein [Thermohalobaculum sp.]|nr:sodium:solute symporter family protein [Thermohalobaculum sp.]